jgi:RNA polymerase-binding transcription factor DksA
MANQEVREDEEFARQQGEVNKAMESVHEALKPNDTMICVECDEPIEPERKEALPSAVTCSDCALFLAKIAARKAKLKAGTVTAIAPDWGKL